MGKKSLMISCVLLALCSFAGAGEASINIGKMFEMMRGHATTMLVETIKWGFLYGLGGLLFAFVLYFGGTKLGLLAVRGKTGKWAKIVYGVVLFVVVWPLIGAAGVVVGVREGTTRIIIAEAHKYKLLRPVGAVLTAPVAIAHVLAESNSRISNVEKTIEELLDGQDVSFLLDKNACERAFAKLTGKVVNDALKEAGIEEKLLNTEYCKGLKKSQIGRWLIAYVKDLVLESVQERMFFDEYRRMFQGFEATDGKLSFWHASDRVGENMFRIHLLIYVERPFDILVVKILIVDLLIFLATIALIQTIARLTCKKSEPKEDAAENKEEIPAG